LTSVLKAVFHVNVVICSDNVAMSVWLSYHKSQLTTRATSFSEKNYPISQNYRFSLKLSYSSQNFLIQLYLVKHGKIQYCKIIKTNSMHKNHKRSHSTITTRQHTNLHQPTSNLTGYQQGIYYSGVRVYNHLNSHIKQLSDDPKKFELQLKEFLYLRSFYSLEEYFKY
jgi:hypothetical protein